MYRFLMSARFFGWSTPLCGCCADPKSCCYVTWCLPCAYGDIVQRFPAGSMCCAGNRNGAAASFLGLIFADCFFSALKNQKGAGNFIVGTAGQAGAEIAEGFLLSDACYARSSTSPLPQTSGSLTFASGASAVLASCAKRCAKLKSETKKRRKTSPS